MKRFDDFLQFGTLLMATRDYDPIYYLLREVIRSEGLDTQQAHWLLWNYLTFYNTSSAWACFMEFPQQPLNNQTLDAIFEWEKPLRKRLTINVERRGMRGGAWLDGLWPGLLNQTHGQSIHTWLMAEVGTGPLPAEVLYEHLWARVQTLPYIGRWAAFKWLDLLQNVLDWPIAPPDMRMAYCSGPRQALEELYELPDSGRQDDAYITYLDGLGLELKTACAQAGLILTWDTLETVLCNYHSLAHGRYYVGHDIDEHLENTRRGVGRMEPWLAARSRVLDARLLGEHHGWEGVRKPLCKLYKEERAIYCDWGAQSPWRAAYLP